MTDFLQKWKSGLERTRKVTFGRIANFFGATEITEETWEELEAMLFQADVGIETTQSIIDNLQEIVSQEGITQPNELISFLRQDLINRLTPGQVNFDWPTPAVVLVVGVNGSGKTTTIAKIANLFASQGKKVLLAAADTYRAAAIDQLQSWGNRLNIPVIAGQENSDPGAIAYDAVQSGISRNMDIIIVDTAGRLHTRYNLMEELKKVDRVIRKALPDAPHASWLVLDATTGQNAIFQARAFKEAINISGIILAKLDSSARGGMTFAIQKELELPILFAGLGEKIEDIEPFDREAFVDGILST